MSRLLVLNPSSFEGRKAVEAAVRLGHEVHAVWPSAAAPKREPQPEIERSFGVDFSSARAAIAAIVDYALEHRIAGLFTQSEFLTPIAARACAELSFPGNDASRADAARDKLAMADRFARSSVAAPRTAAAAVAADVLALMRAGQLRLPLVVKPVAQAGSKGVTVVSRAEELDDAIARARVQPAPFGVAVDVRVLVQEYVDGDEYSVESVTQAGTTVHLCITRKVATGGRFRVEVGHSLPAELDDAARRRVEDEVGKAIRAVGITDSVSHTEIKMRPDGAPKVIEIAARAGAGRIGTLLEFALGVDLARAQVELALGRPVDLRGHDHRRCAAVRLLLPPSAGRLVAVNHLPEVGSDVVAAALTTPPGATITAPSSNHGRLGYFVVVGSRERDVNRRADELVRRVEIIVDQGRTEPERRSRVPGVVDAGVTE